VKGNEKMADIPELSEARRALLEKYLRGEVLSAKATTDTTTRHQENARSQPSTDTRSIAVPVQTSGSKPPFFYLHVHWAGGAFYSLPLAHDLGLDQPFYLLDPYKFDGLRVPPTLEAMAADYVKALRTVQPTGPYFIGGFCGAGILAFEMAQQLRAAWQSVDLLVLIEPGVTGRMMRLLEPHGPTFLKLVSGFVRRMGKLLRIGPDKQLDMFLYVRHMHKLLRYSQYRKSEGFSLIPTSKTLRQDWMGIFVWIVSDYVACYYPGKITYFWAREESGSRKSAWDKMATTAEEVEFHAIAGTHDSCRNEDLHDLAKHLRECLSKVQSV